MSYAMPTSSTRVGGHAAPPPGAMPGAGGSGGAPPPGPGFFDDGGGGVPQQQGGGASVPQKEWRRDPARARSRRSRRAAGSRGEGGGRRRRGGATPSGGEQQQRRGSTETVREDSRRRMDVQAMAEAAWNEEETAIVERGRLLKRLVLAKHVEIATLDKLIEQELWEQRALKRILNPQGHEPGHGGHPRSDLATSDLDVTSPETGFTAHDSDMNGMGRFTGNGDDDPTPLMRGATDSMGSPVGYIRQGSSSANVGEQRGSRTRMPGMRHSAGVGRFDDGEDGGGYDDGDEEEYDDDISDGGKDDDEIEFDEY